MAEILRVSRLYLFSSLHDKEWPGGVTEPVEGGEPVEQRFVVMRSVR